jgi:hypothetical protein
MQQIDDEEFSKLAKYDPETGLLNPSAWRFHYSHTKPVDSTSGCRIAIVQAIWQGLEVKGGAIQVSSLDVWNREPMVRLLAMAEPDAGVAPGGNYSWSFGPGEESLDAMAIAALAATSNWDLVVCDAQGRFVLELNHDDEFIVFANDEQSFKVAVSIAEAYSGDPSSTGTGESPQGHRRFKTLAPFLWGVTIGLLVWGGFSIRNTVAEVSLAKERLYMGNAIGQILARPEFKDQEAGTIKLPQSIADQPDAGDMRKALSTIHSKEISFVKYRDKKEQRFLAYDPQTKQILADGFMPGPSQD